MADNSFVGSFCESDAWQNYGVDIGGVNGSVIGELPFLSYTPCFEDAVLLGTVRVCLVITCIRRLQILHQKSALKLRLRRRWPHICQLLLVVLMVLVPVLQLGGRLAQGQEVAVPMKTDALTPIAVFPPVAPFEVAGFSLEFLAWIFVGATLIRELVVYSPHGAWLLRFSFIFAFLTNSIKLWFIYRVVTHIQIFYILFFVTYGALAVLAVTAAVYHPAVVLQDGSAAPLLDGECEEVPSARTDFSQTSLSQIDAVQGTTHASPEEKANIFSRLFFCWVTPMLSIGYKRPLEESDMWDLAVSDCSTTVTSHLDAPWASEKGQLKATGETVTLQQAVVAAWIKPFIISGIWKIGNDAQQFSGPIFMNLLLKAITRLSTCENKDEHDDACQQTLYKAYLCAVGMFCFQIFGCVSEAQYFQRTMRCGMQIRSAIMHTLFAKSLRLSNASKAKFNVGRLNNMMASDCEAIQQLVNSLHTVWSAPLRIIVAMSLLFWQVGWAAITGFVVIVLAIPLNKYVMSLMSTSMRESTKATDERVRLTNEAFGAIQVVKLYAWEKSFAAATKVAREEELVKILRFAMLRARSTFLVTAIPIIVSTGTFVTFTVIYGSDKLTPDVAFTALSLLGVLQGPLNNLPSIINQVTQALVSLERLNEVMLAEELSSWEEPVGIKDGEIEFQNCVFKWDSQAADGFSLSRLQLRVDPGQFVAVVGKTGSGKSSLLAAILGDMPIVQGSVRMSKLKPIAYVPQKAFIFNATIRENILFGASFDKDRYNLAVEASCLTKDFSRMPAGELTEIGEKGVNLSGGQKQRVSLARALYHHHKASVFLLDDPLSALDASVARQVHEKAFLGILKGKTRVLVTNRVEFVASCDVSVIMVGGAIEDSGSYQDVLKRSEEFSKLMKEGGAVEEAGASETTAVPAAKAKIEKPKEATNSPAADGSLVKAEHRAKGVVSQRVVRVYMEALGGCCTVLVIGMSFVLVEVCRSGASFWLSVWSTHADQLSVMHAVGVYALFNTATLVINYLNQVLLARQGVKGGAVMHAQMYARLLRAPMAFFDTTPLGRVLNRFTKDVSDVDKNTITVIAFFLRSCIQMCASLIIIGCTAYYALFAFAPIFMMLYWVQQYYSVSAREIKRLDSLTRSPIYQEYGATLDGMPSVRAYMKQQHILRRSGVSIDRHIKTNLASMSTNRWLTLRLETLGGTLVLVVACFSVAAREILGAGFAGLALSYALQMIMMTQVLTRTLVMAEQGLNSVERLDEYGKGIDEEAPAEIEATRPTEHWPAKGRIEFKDVWCSYREGLPPVLKGLSFTVESGHKVGIAGRSGAGKSSTLLALFRIVESSKGSITIDGADIRNLGLFDLRSRLGIIPQEPFIFKGTIRSNLDPFKNHTDDQLWKALQQAHLASVIQSGENNGLNVPVDEGGANLSVGQRQLVCLARAVLRGAKILVLDEATASVDAQTDTLIQQTIRVAFAECTMLTIAHRLQTIIDSDKILVMDAGIVAEYDSPARLLSNRDGAFYSMVQDTGKATADSLISIALGGAPVMTRQLSLDMVPGCHSPIYAAGASAEVHQRRQRTESFTSGDELSENLKELLKKASSAAEELQSAARDRPVSAAAFEELLQLQRRLEGVFGQMERSQNSDVTMES